MKRVLVGIFAALLLAGCSSALQTGEETTLFTYHADHHVAQTRKGRNFFLERVDEGEFTSLTLSYREPDGCVTRLCEVEMNPGHTDPQLFEQGDAFYYILYENDVFSTSVTSDGYLYCIDFAGSKRCLEIPEGVALGPIVKTDENFIYCTVQDAKFYLCADLALTGWEEISQEDAT